MKKPEWIPCEPETHAEKEWKPYTDITGLGPMVAGPQPGYNRETVDASFDFANFPDDYVWPLFDRAHYFHDFKLHFLGKEHYNYISMGEESTVGPVIITCEKVPPPDSLLYATKHHLKVLVQTKKGTERLSLPMKKIEEAKTAIKAIKTVKPELAKLRFVKAKGPDIEKHLQLYEQQLIRTVYKFGVLYCKEGQTDENEMYNNEHGSPNLDEFLAFLGETIALQGFTGYRGGLDVKENTTGTHSVYTKHIDDCEIMFHVSTLLQYYPQDPQQVERKRHLGNDVIMIVFREGNDHPPFDMTEIHSHFNHVFFVVQKDEAASAKHGVTCWRIESGFKEGVLPYDPPLPAPPVFVKNDAKCRSWFLTKLINAERAAYYAPDFIMKFRNTRKTQLQNIVKVALENTPKRRTGSQILRSGSRLKQKGMSIFRSNEKSDELPPDFFSAPTNFVHVAHMDNEGKLESCGGVEFFDIFAPEGMNALDFRFDSDSIVPAPSAPPAPTSSAQDDSSNNHPAKKKSAAEDVKARQMLTRGHTSPRLKPGDGGDLKAAGGNHYGTRPSARDVFKNVNGNHGAANGGMPPLPPTPGSGAGEAPSSLVVSLVAGSSGMAAASLASGAAASGDGSNSKKTPVAGASPGPAKRPVRAVPAKPVPPAGLGHSGDIPLPPSAQGKMVRRKAPEPPGAKRSASLGTPGSASPLASSSPVSSSSSVPTSPSTAPASFSPSSPAQPGPPRKMSSDSMLLASFSPSSPRSTPATAAAAAASTSAPSITFKEPRPSSPSTPVASPSTPTSTNKTAPALRRGRAMWDFTAENSNELSCKRGDVLLVYEDNGDWVDAELNGERGWIPTNYVHFVDTNTLSTPAAVTSTPPAAGLTATTDPSNAGDAAPPPAAGENGTGAENGGEEPRRRTLRRTPSKRNSKKLPPLPPGTTLKSQSSPRTASAGGT